MVQLDYRDATGKRRNPNKPNWPLAREEARKIDRKLEAGIQLDESAPTFGRAWDEWYKHQELMHARDQRRGNTLANYRASREHLTEFERSVTDDDSNEPPDPIWHRRFAIALPGDHRLIEGIAVDVSDHNGVALLPPPDGEERIIVPPDARPWVADAVRLFEGGWRIPDVARHVGKDRTSINVAFKRHGLPAPNDIRLAARNRRFEQLYNEGYGTAEIATLTGINQTTINAWRQLQECDMPQNTKSLRTLQKSGTGGGSRATKRKASQLNLL